MKGVWADDNKTPARAAQRALPGVLREEGAMMDFQLTGSPLPDVRRYADISPCGLYRYSLTRVWANGRLVAWVMLNPSTADDLLRAKTGETTLDVYRCGECGWLHVGKSRFRRAQ